MVGLGSRHVGLHHTGNSPTCSKRNYSATATDIRAQLCAPDTCECSGARLRHIYTYVPSTTADIFLQRDSHTHFFI